MKQLAQAHASRMHGKSLIERALELAGAGESIERIERQLNAEGYSNVLQHLDSRSLRRQLREVSRAALGKPRVVRGRPPSTPGTSPDA
ncbi:hypothetical protein ACCC88_03300 [Sphingomonas sp. Sphisp140]|uniref:hypothetical protein n=1 Tax=unclassified Sphingomonas TaxID=196159 RepID=UPI0039AFA0FC